MACRGVHFAITQADVEQMRALEDDDERVSYVCDVIEERWEQDWVYETDKAWDAIHRALGDGTIDLSRVEFPLGHAIFGGEYLVALDDYYIVLNTPAQAVQIGEALRRISRDEMRTRYFALSPKEYGMELTEDDCEYTWAYFEGLGDFFVRAGQAGRSVIFTVDQ